jgi:flagellar protein FliO/FliZ
MKGRTTANRGGAMGRHAGVWGSRTMLWGPLSLGAAGAGAAEGPAASPAVPGVEVLGQVTLSLILVVALLLALAWALRRFSRLQPQEGVSLRLLGGLSLGARERILLVQADDRRLLVGVSPGGLRTLLVLDEGAGAPGEASQPRAGGAQGALGPSWRVE